jgi:flagellar motor switch protein FliG
VKLENLTGVQKTAILLVAIGPEPAAKIFKNLKEKDIERITFELANLDEITSEIIDEVIDEFFQMVKAQDYISIGGIDYAEKILLTAVGAEKAHEIVRRVQSVQSQAQRGFNLLKRADHNQILNLISGEHPQTIALILAHLETRQAANILMGLGEELRADVVYRIATMEKVSSDLLEELEDALKGQIELVYTREMNEAGGKESVAEILNLAGKSAERGILEGIERRDAELAQDIRNLMFVFDDILMLDDRSIQRLMKDVDTKTLAVALKGSSAEIRDRILKNISERAASMIKEEMEYMGPIRVKEVDDAQQRIVDVIRDLEEAGDIVIMGGEGGDEFIQ